MEDDSFVEQIEKILDERDDDGGPTYEELRAAVDGPKNDDPDQRTFGGKPLDEYVPGADDIYEQIKRRGDNLKGDIFEQILKRHDKTKQDAYDRSMKGVE